MKKSGGAALVALVGLGSWGCVPSYEEKKGKPLDSLTLQSLLQWPADKDYLEAPGSGRPPDGEKKVEVRRKAAREAAVMEAQRELIAMLEKMVPRNRVREILKKAEVAGVEYTYDDGCRLRLRVSKEVVVGEKPLE